MNKKPNSRTTIKGNKLVRVLIDKGLSKAETKSFMVAADGLKKYSYSYVVMICLEKKIGHPSAIDIGEGWTTQF